MNQKETLPTSEHFYTDLMLQKAPLSALLTDDSSFRNIPNDWHVVITDIVGSTDAVFAGRHKDVNLIATGSIVSVLNIAFGMAITVPFFFGGDGATFIVPPSLISKVMHVLSLYRITTKDNFGLELRVGTVSVASIYGEGHAIRIAKYSSTGIFSIPIVLGNGLNRAEQIIKGEGYFLSGYRPEEVLLDLSGMQCRWDTIAPPDDKEEIVTLLVIARNTAQQAPAFAKVLCRMDALYGILQKRQPISVGKLQLKSTFSKLSTEMRVRIGRIHWMELLRTWLTTWYGRFYFKTKKGKEYLKNLVDMSDTLVVDGKINTVISGTVAQRKTLEHLLNEMEAEGDIVFGLHTSEASIMSCYVRDIKDGHVHFVDGSEGGYTKAAKMLKMKLLIYK